ncbi:hypothetical protein Ping_2931 [Psychromonas ingrahamii 37]|uniref:Uncharacterized protein n=1 Tax=Psychromonas ingrahamii (strain DSM 17664 / CCUG 51855 / 37) TaxID=357804 RepID=A1SYR8_PSYIN|nr:hypothetical protein [Psychromonas ingrahamii]ABM04633.1 hypothetical protein Ping_2931 [Psychromonas ingrahamii 37]
MNKVIEQATKNIKLRSEYLLCNRKQAEQGYLACVNLAHTVVFCGAGKKSTMFDFIYVNVGIISAYNDILSAHQPYQNYPNQIKTALKTDCHRACCHSYYVGIFI